MTRLRLACFTAFLSGVAVPAPSHAQVAAIESLAIPPVASGEAPSSTKSPYSHFGSDSTVIPFAGGDGAPAVVQDAAVQPSAAELGDIARQFDQGAWWAGLELTLLRPRYSNSEFSLYPGGSLVGPRLVIGYDNGEGRGYRARFWGFGDDVLAQRDDPFDVGVVNDPVRYSAWRMDFDEYRSWLGKYGQLLVGASLTVANLRMDEALSRELHELALGAPPGSLGRAMSLAQEQGEYIGVGGTRETAAGLGLFAEGREPFRVSDNSQWAGIVRGRTALLMGEWKSPMRAGRINGDATMLIHEAAVGIEFERQFQRMVAWARVLAEYQVWDATIIDDLGLAGVTVGAGMDW
jgi:hypothetical protein